MADARSPLDLRSMLFGAFWATVGILATEHFFGPMVERRTRPPEEHLLGLVHGTLREQYVEPRHPAEIMRAGVAGMVESLDDPYSSYVGPEQLREFEEESSGTLIGIGAMVVEDRVYFPYPDGPAEEAGLRPGDRFLAIDGKPVAEWEQAQLVERLRGVAGSVATLAMKRPDGRAYRVQVERAAVPIVTVGDVRIVDEEAGVGHLHLRSFARSTVAELDRALEKLHGRGLRGLVLDLRWNIGGQLAAAVQVASRFMQGELVCTLKDREGHGGRHRAEPGAYGGAIPVVLLVNAWSASGSEVVAAALRDWGYAAVVGEYTYGKGVYQHVYRYDEGDFVLKIPAGYYVTPGGRILEGHVDPEIAGGIEPDLLMPLDEDTSQQVHRWLLRNEVPPRHREAVLRHFPERAGQTRPPDPQLDAATRLLATALTAS